MPALRLRRVVAVAFAWASLTLVLAPGGHADTSPACDPDGPKLDCGGAAGADEAACTAAGCCWHPLEHGSAEPWCFVANGGDSEYAVVEAAGSTTLVPPSALFTSTLVQTAATLPALGPDASHLNATVDATCSDVFHLRLEPAGAGASPAYSVPRGLFAGGLDPRPCPPGPPAYAAWVKHAPFGVHVAAADDPGDAGAPLFDTTGHRLIVKPRYVEWTTALHPASTMYGLGERTGTLVVDRGAEDGSTPPPRPRTIWARDRPAWAPGENLYGAWPAWVEVLPSGSARGGLVVTGTAVDVLARPGSLSFRCTGGVVDVFVFAGPTPAAVLDQLTRVVGRPALSPAWALGFHQSRWGYRDVDALASVVDGYEAAGLPLDVLWSDIDAMAGRRDFTLSPARYPAAKVRALVARLHAAGRRWVPIVDPGIKVEKGYAPYEDGLAAGVFVRAPGAGGSGGGPPFTGRVWPGAVHWPDFLAHRTADWWARAIAAFHAVVGFDGLWIDMSEPSNFDTALRDANNPPFLPYPPNNGGARLPLASHTLPPDAVGADGDALHIDTHNLYGHAEARATHRALKLLNPSARPFILTRSSFVGTGAFAAHWTGDNAATWDNLAWSISGVLASGLAGAPMAGADVCGFSGNTTPELCARWVAAAAMQPFMRDHSDLSAAPQELYRWPETTAAARAALGLRYALLPTLYTALARAAATGTPAARPLWWEWPGVAGARADRPQWLVGGLMAAPVVQPGVASVQAWLPPGSAWVDVRPLLGGGDGGGRILRPGANSSVLLDAPLTGAPPVLLACGRAVPAAAAVGKTAEATLVSGGLAVVACLDGGGAAAGELWADDGVSEAGPATAGWFDLAVGGSGMSVVVRGEGRLDATRPYWPRLMRVVVVVGEGWPGATHARARNCGGEVEGTIVRDGRDGVLEVAFEGGGVAVVCAGGGSGVDVAWWAVKGGG